METYIIYIAIVIAIFIILRKINLWYWRINEMIELMQKTINHQDNISNLLCGIALKQGVEQGFFPSKRKAEEEYDEDRPSGILKLFFGRIKNNLKI